MNCAFTYKNKTNTALLHFDLQNKLYCLELLKYGMSKYFINVRNMLKDAFALVLFMIIVDFIIQTLSCKNLLSLHKSQYISPIPIPSFAHFSNSHFEEFATENNDLINKSFQYITVKFKYLQCEIESLFATLFPLLGRLYPERILSALTGTPTVGKPLVI